MITRESWAGLWRRVEQKVQEEIAANDEAQGDDGGQDWDNGNGSTKSRRIAHYKELNPGWSSTRSSSSSSSSAPIVFSSMDQQAIYNVHLHDSPTQYPQSEKTNIMSKRSRKISRSASSSSSLSKKTKNQTINQVKSEPGLVLPSWTLETINSFRDAQLRKWNVRDADICAYACAGLLSHLRYGHGIDPSPPPTATTDEIELTLDTDEHSESHTDVVMTWLKANKSNQALRKLLERECMFLGAEENDSEVTVVGEVRLRSWIPYDTIHVVFEQLKHSSAGGCGFLFLPATGKDKEDDVGHVLAWIRLASGKVIVVDATIRDAVFHGAVEEESEDYLSMNTFNTFYTVDMDVQISPIFVVWCSGGSLSEKVPEVSALQVQHSELLEMIQVKKEGGVSEPSLSSSSSSSSSSSTSSSAARPNAQRNMARRK
jgi:hypothetical protein